MGQTSSTLFECEKLFIELEKNPHREAPELKALFSYFDINNNNSLEKNTAQSFFECLYDFLGSRNHPYPLKSREITISEWLGHYLDQDGFLTFDKFVYIVQILGNPEAIEKAEEEKIEKRKIKLELHHEMKATIHDGDQIVGRSKFIPLRLREYERGLLQILEGALVTSEYTDRVDVARARQKKTEIIKNELHQMFGYIAGLYLTQNYKSAIQNKFFDNTQVKEEFFQNIFEIGRRNKIMNPEKMRSTYGKMMFMLSDSHSFKTKLIVNIRSVYEFLSERGYTKFLEDPNIIPATQCLIASSKSELADAAIAKKNAKEALIRTYCSEKFSKEDLLLCIDSLSDSNAYIATNRYPVDRMIKYLLKYFDPKTPERAEFSLAISRGKGGSFLTHSHATQFKFVHQSLQLWREIQHEMFHLWNCADSDLLSGNYSLTNTGQGLNRLQSAPKVALLMSKILSRVKSRTGDWVGLSVVHLGDRDVPNALFFIDKYTQVPRILSPIVQTLDNLHQVLSPPSMQSLVSPYGSIDNIKKKILTDFFKYAFDGSGDDGGSCIDGRLTSAWNWSSKIEKKDYFIFMLLTGFTGFDGNFKK